MPKTQAQTKPKEGSSIAKKAVKATKAVKKAANTNISKMKKAMSSSTDAIDMLKADHRKVEELFSSFETARNKQQKQKIAYQICMELIIHTMLEEEMFYPRFRGEIDDNILDEAYVEHDGAKFMISDILSCGPDDEFYDAKVKVLSEEIKHHVNEEEQRGGMFAQAKKTDTDFDELGAQMKEYKLELKEKFERRGLPTPETRTMNGAPRLRYGYPVESAA